MGRKVSVALLAALSFPTGASATWSACKWVYAVDHGTEVAACQWSSGTLRCELGTVTQKKANAQARTGGGSAAALAPGTFNAQTVLGVAVDGGKGTRLSAGDAFPLSLAQPELAVGAGWRSGTGIECNATENALTCGSLKTHHGFAISQQGRTALF